MARRRFGRRRFGRRGRRRRNVFARRIGTRFYFDSTLKRSSVQNFMTARIKSRHNTPPYIGLPLRETSRRATILF